MNKVNSGGFTEDDQANWVKDILESALGKGSKSGLGMKSSTISSQNTELSFIPSSKISSSTYSGSDSDDDHDNLNFDKTGRMEIAMKLASRKSNSERNNPVRNERIIRKRSRSRSSSQSRDSSPRGSCRSYKNLKKKISSFIYFVKVNKRIDKNLVMV